MAIWFTADTHFGHKNIIKFCNRPFSSIEEMDAALITAWNDVVQLGDTVYLLGDFTLGYQAQPYFGRLKGTVKIIPGGHDKRWIHGKYTTLSGPVEKLPTCYTAKLWYNNERSLYVVLCHYALQVWDRSHYGSLHFYGHSHGRLEPYPNALDVGVDKAAQLLGEYRPFSLEEAVSLVGR